MMTSTKQICRCLTVGFALSLLGLAASCRKSEIVISYKVNVESLGALTASTNPRTFATLPAPTTIIARGGTNLNSQSKQPDGIIDWFQYENQNLGISTNADRWITIDLKLFARPEDARKYMESESRDRWYKPRLDKFTTGTLSNGMDYCGSYIQQARSCPAGLSLPMNAYSSFLIVRSGNILAVVDAYEIETRHPRGVTDTELESLSRLLRQ